VRPQQNPSARDPLRERALAGLHEFVAQHLPVDPQPSDRAFDLGTGSGAFAQRLSAAGWPVEAADLDRSAFKAQVPFHRFDLDSKTWPMESRSYSLVTAIEVIEHVRDPIGFLMNVGNLLKRDGHAVVTSPNMDSLAARSKFLITGKLRQMDEQGDPTHITPIFLTIFRERYLPAAGLLLTRRLVYPPASHAAVRPWIRRLADGLGPFLPRSFMGDTNVFFLRREPP
jgi:SAM-dependent methyltransferase